MVSGVPRCESCNKRWRLKQTIVKTSAIDVDLGMNCPYCDELQFLDAKSLKRNKVWIFFPLIMLIVYGLLNLWMSLPFWSFILYLLLIVVIFIVFYPRSITVTNAKPLQS